jgi:hypothetical protein
MWKSELSVFLSAKKANVESIFVFGFNTHVVKWIWMYSNPIFNIIRYYLTKI